MLAELIQNATHSTAAGTLGVTAIWVYMAIIVTTAMYRIKNGDHMHH